MKTYSALLWVGVFVAAGSLTVGCKKSSNSNGGAGTSSAAGSAGTSAATGGTGAATGGTSAATGGTSAATGGTSAATGGTSAATGGTSAGSAGTSAGTGAAEMPSCDEYCTLIAANCKDANAQYGGADADATCKAVCADWDLGVYDETSNDTVGCHQYHAEAAMGDPGLHCMHAGPTGGAVCGASACDDFCDVALKACTGANEQWSDKAACMTDCATYATDPAYDPTQTSGDTFACREYHLTAAAVDPATHCAHVAKVSAACK